MDAVRSGNGRKAVFIVSFMNKAGAQRAAHRVARGLRERGWDIELWFLYKVADDAFPGVPVRVFYEDASPGASGYMRILFSVISAMRSSRPDAVVSFLPLASIVGQTAAFIARVPRRIASLRSPGTTFDTPMRQLDMLFGTIGLYSRIVSVSQAVADEATDYPARYRRLIDVVHNGVESFKTDLSKDEARKALGLPDTGVLALNVGRMAPQKNYPFLLDIAERLEHATLVCIGDGPERGHLTSEIARRGLGDKIRLLGALPADRVPLAYRAAEIFVQPSLYEGQSNTLLEAMSAGLPVIVSDVPSQTETVIGDADGPWGLALPINDAALWAREIDRLATDTDRRDEYARLAAQRAGHFTVEGQIDGFEAAILGTHTPAQHALAARTARRNPAGADQ
jgi:glycosyltransferase involved in cell wall biosynthesis